MAEIKIRVTVDSKEIDSILSSINKGFRDFKKPLKEIWQMQLKEVDEAFKVRWKNIIWTSWTPLKPATTRQKIKLWLNKDILQRSGKLRKSFKRQQLRKNKLVIWSKIKYFSSHQRWTNKIPQRQILWHGNIMIKKTQILATKYLLNLIKKWMTS